MEIQVTFDKTFNFNTTLQFKFNAGFILSDMYEGYRQCKENKTWSGLEPTCSGNYLGHQREMGLCGVCCQQRVTPSCAIRDLSSIQPNILIYEKV